MLMKLGAAVLAVPVAAVTLVAGTVARTGLMLVDVRSQDQHIVVPVPLGLARLALSLAPDSRAQLHKGVPPAQALLARAVVQALAAAPDGELVRALEPGQQVVIAKQGQLLRINVHDKEQDLTAALPLQAALRLIPRDGRALEPAALVSALDELRFTDLLEVRHGDEHVRVWVF